MRKSLFLVLAALVLLASCKKESSEKKILTFKFASPAVEATIEESAHTIVAVVPFGTNVTGLVPIITISEKASVVPASGTPVDFTNPVDFTVTAEDGSSVVYKVTVTVDANGGGGGGGGGTGDPTHFEGIINNNTTWPDLGLDVDYVIDGWVDIDGNALLTIEPGVTIMFAGEGCGMSVGENAGLRMVGTAEKPIILEGPTHNPNNGSWSCVVINSNRADNVFEYVQFLRGGSEIADWGGVVHLTYGRLSMKNCLIDGSLSNGVVTEYESYFNAFENNTVKNCADYPWKTENFPALCKNIGTGQSFIGNGTNMICLDGTGYCELQENLTLSKQPVPYYFRSGMGFEGTKTQTIEPGVEIVMPIFTGMRVAAETGFIANGTANEPIIFRCEDASEAWNGIIFDSQRNNNVINYCQIKNCGLNADDWAQRACLYINGEAKLTLTNNVFGPSNYNGVTIENIENWGNVTHSGNTFVECAAGNVWLGYGGIYNGVEYEGGQTLDDLP